MEIILLKDVDNVGDKHTIVKVKDGFGRNYLIPQGLALVANDTNRRKLNEIIRLDDKRESQRLDVYQEMAATLTGSVGWASRPGVGKGFGYSTPVRLANPVPLRWRAWRLGGPPLTAVSILSASVGALGVLAIHP